MHNAHMADFETSPILQSLSDEMTSCTFTNAAGDIVIAYTEEMTSPVSWIEFDTSTNDFHLINDDGQMQPLSSGEISADMKNNILTSKEAILMRVKDKKILSLDKVSVIIKDY